MLQIAINKLFNLFIHKKQSTSLRRLQWNVLKKKLANSKNSELGKKYHFDKIRSIEDYQKSVPVHRYEDILPYWEKEINGEQKQSVNEHIKSFVWTSGTSGNKKLIPVTQMVLDDIKRSHLFFSSCIVKKNPLRSCHEITFT